MQPPAQRDGGWTEGRMLFTIIARDWTANRFGAGSSYRTNPWGKFVTCRSPARCKRAPRCWPPALSRWFTSGLELANKRNQMGPVACRQDDIYNR